MADAPSVYLDALVADSGSMLMSAHLAGTPVFADDTTAVEAAPACGRHSGLWIEASPRRRRRHREASPSVVLIYCVAGSFWISSTTDVVAPAARCDRRSADRRGGSALIRRLDGRRTGDLDALQRLLRRHAEAPAMLIADQRGQHARI